MNEKKIYYKLIKNILKLLKTITQNTFKPYSNIGNKSQKKKTTNQGSFNF